MDGQCNALIYKRDCYRVSRGHGFKLHYAREQCSRKATAGDLCKQHAAVEKTRFLPRWNQR